MTEKRIEITINPDGTISSEVIGVAGADCTKLVEFLDSLGRVTRDEHTSDYYKTARQTIRAGKS